MPSRNRVTPTGEIVAIPLRGALCGNRGILHRGTEIVRFHASDLWITCALEFQGRRQVQWRPHHYTLLFFHDEAVSLAAGHRPCAFCRRSSYDDFRAAIRRTEGVPLLHAKDLDRRLHTERIVRGTHRRQLHRMPWTSLPDGSFVVHEDQPTLVFEDRLVPWTVQGYSPPMSRPGAGTADVLTPPISLAALVGGYRAQVDADAVRSPHA